MISSRDFTSYYLTIFQQHFTKSTFTYYLIFTNFPIYQTSFIYYKTTFLHCIHKKYIHLYKVINLWKKTLSCTSWGRCSTWMEEWSCNQIMWCNYVKPVQILKRYTNNFFHWVEILGRRPGNQALQRSCE